jgi:hypothetical protein
MDLSILQPTTDTHLKGNPRAAEAGHFFKKIVNIQNYQLLPPGGSKYHHKHVNLNFDFDFTYEENI